MLCVPLLYCLKLGLSDDEIESLMIDNANCGLIVEECLEKAEKAFKD